MLFRMTQKKFKLVLPKTDLFTHSFLRINYNVFKILQFCDFVICVFA